MTLKDVRQKLQEDSGKMPYIFAAGSERAKNCSWQ